MAHASHQQGDGASIPSPPAKDSSNPWTSDTGSHAGGEQADQLGPWDPGNSVAGVLGFCLTPARLELTNPTPQKHPPEEPQGERAPPSTLQTALQPVLWPLLLSGMTLLP